MSCIIEEGIDVFGICQRSQSVAFLLQRSPEIVVKLFKSNKVSGTMKPQVPITCEFLHFFLSFAIFSVWLLIILAQKLCCLMFVSSFTHFACVSFAESRRQVGS